MLDKVRIFCSDIFWLGILSDLDAVIVTDKNDGVDFDKIAPVGAVSMSHLKEIILDEIENEWRKIEHEVFGKKVTVSELQKQILIALYKLDGATMQRLRESINTTTISNHALDNAVHELRRTFGREFIRCENGKYFINNI